MLLVASQDKWQDCVENEIVCVAMPVRINDFINTCGNDDSGNFEKA